MKKCSRCETEATKKSGHQWLCQKHYRFGQMRIRARLSCKKIPSHSELEEITPPDMICVGCKRVMNWMKRDGSDTVATLQHDRSGKLRILCQSCNTRHYFFEGDTFYTHDHSTRKCIHCEKFKPLDDFFTANGRWMNKHNVCKPCCKLKNQERINKDVKKRNTYQREYYKRRIESGNPIPRSRDKKKVAI